MYLSKQSWGRHESCVGDSPGLFQENPVATEKLDVEAVASPVGGNAFGCTGHDDIALFECHESSDLFDDLMGLVDHQVVMRLLGEGTVVPESETYIF